MDSFRTIIPFFARRVNGQIMGRRIFEKLNGNARAKSGFSGKFHNNRLDKPRRIGYNEDGQRVEFATKTF